MRGKHVQDSYLKLNVLPVKVFTCFWRTLVFGLRSSDFGLQSSVSSLPNLTSIVKNKESNLNTDIYINKYNAKHRYLKKSNS